MPESARTAPTPSSALQDIKPARAILGRRPTAVLLKRRKRATKHPYNRMFLMFDDGSGMEFFFPGLLLPEEFLDADSFSHIVRRRRKSRQTRTAFRARLDANRRTPPPRVESFCRGARTGKDGSHDKSIVGEILGRRIECVYLFLEIGNRRPMRYLDFVFSDGTAFEFVVFGPAFACRQTESFELFGAMRRGLNAYENELLALANPDGSGIATPINRPHRWSDLDE